VSSPDLALKSSHWQNVHRLLRSSGQMNLLHLMQTDGDFLSFTH